MFSYRAHVNQIQSQIMNIKLWKKKQYLPKNEKTSIESL